MLPHESAR